MLKKIAALLLASLLIWMTGCAPSLPDTPDAGRFVLTFITVGKGDAFLIQTPENRHYMIDVGKAEDYDQIARLLRVRSIEKLDGIFLTHGHKDHVGCLETLLRVFPTDRVYYSAIDDASYHEIIPHDLALREGAEPVVLHGGEVLDLGGAEAAVWLPDAVDYANENNNSLVLMLTHGSKKFLMTGDMELEEEALLMQTDFALQADVLKLGHHGENDSTSPAFLDRVSPSIGLIAGNAEENPESMDEMIATLLSTRKVRSYYSESSGLGIDFISDGKHIQVKTADDQKTESSLSLIFESVTRKPKEERCIRIQNTGSTAADLRDCVLLAGRSSHFVFPDCRLEPGAVLTLTVPESRIEGDLCWEKDRTFSKKDDLALYDRDMNLLDEDKAS